MSFDISPILKDWDADPEAKYIRKIIGTDGKEKIQIRVELGLLQMEADGRPDGKKPYGKESLLEHYTSLLENYRKEYETEEGFKLDHHDCERLREESVQYYHRYISLFEIGDYHRVERDTVRNLRVFDIVRKYAENQDDSLSLEKYRPYVIMMNTRARALIMSDKKNYAEAIDVLEEAIEEITNFYRDHELGEDEIAQSQELEILKAAIKEIHDKWEG